jgi:acyl carrier protein
MTPTEERVAHFISEQTGSHRAILPSTTLLGDLGVDGEDGIDLLDAFAKAFDVDMTSCDPQRYFGPEGCYPWAPLYWLIVAFRKGTHEQRVGLEKISIGDLAKCVEAGRWVV